MTGVVESQEFGLGFSAWDLDCDIVTQIHLQQLYSEWVHKSSKIWRIIFSITALLKLNFPAFLQYTSLLDKSVVWSSSMAVYKMEDFFDWHLFQVVFKYQAQGYLSSLLRKPSIHLSHVSLLLFDSTLIVALFVTIWITSVTNDIFIHLRIFIINMIGIRTSEQYTCLETHTISQCCIRNVGCETQIAKKTMSCEFWCRARLLYCYFCPFWINSTLVFGDFIYYVCRIVNLKNGYVTCRNGSLLCCPLYMVTKHKGFSVSGVLFQVFLTRD